LKVDEGHAHLVTEPILGLQGFKLLGLISGRGLLLQLRMLRLQELQAAAGGAYRWDNKVVDLRWSFACR
jgi:hypothetical protein